MNQDNQFSSPSSPLQPPCDLDSYPSPTDKCEHIFITLIRAADVACGLRRIPAGFHIIVEVDGRIVQSSSKPVSTREDAVEWNEKILLPTDLSSPILLSVYASHELGPRLGNGELLRQFKTTVGELFHHPNEQLQPIDSMAHESDIFLSCSSLKIITERRICGANEPCPKLDLPESHVTNALEQLTDEGHRALLRYRQLEDQMDLDAAIEAFERVEEICPIDHPNRSAVLFNLANAKFINCQANNRHLDLDIPIVLYQNALRLRSDDHLDHSTAALGLGLALLARFQRQGLEFDRTEAKYLLERVLEASGAESYAYQAGLFALQIVEASPSVDAGDCASLQTDQANHGDMIQKARDLLRYLSHCDPRRPALLADLGVLLSDRFKRSGAIADIQEAIVMFECAMNLMPHEHTKMPSLLNNFGNSLYRRFQHLGDLADLHRSISMLEKLVGLTPDGHPDKPGRFNNLGNSLSSRFRRLGDLADLNKCILMKEEAVRLTSGDHPDKSLQLNNLGNSLCCRFERLGDLADLNRSISMLEEAVCLTPDDHPDKPGWFNGLGNSLSLRFQHMGDLADLSKSISMFEKAARLTPDGSPNKLAFLNNLGNSLSRRFMRLGDVADLSKSIEMKEEAVYLTPDTHPHKPALLNNLGNSLLGRFEYLGDLVDVNRSISMREQAVRLIPEDHPDKLTLNNGLGYSLSCRFEYLGDVADLNRSISLLEEAVCLTPNGDLDRPGQLSNLGSSLLRRFERLGDLADLNRSISMFEEAACLTLEGHPDRPALLNNLGDSVYRRFERLGDLVDLNRSISLLEEAISLTPDDHPDKPGQSTNFGKSLLGRFGRLGDIADLHKSISILEEAVSLTPDGHTDKPALLNHLGNSLLSRFERLGDLADLNTSISTKQEALRLMPDSHSSKPALLNNLGNSLSQRFQHLADIEDLNQSISMKEEAVRLTPDDNPEMSVSLQSLGNSLLSRFERLGDLADLNKCILMKEKAIHLTPDGHPDKAARLNNLGNSLLRRFERFGNVADLNMSISKQKEAISLTPEGHSQKSIFLNNLGNSLSRRFEQLGDLADLNMSISVLEEAVCLLLDGHPDKPAQLNNLGISLSRRFERLGDLADLNRSISMREEAVCLSPNDHPDKATWLNGLGSSLSRRFERLGGIADLNRSISLLEEAIRLTPDGHSEKLARFNNLANSLLNRFNLEGLGDLVDLNRSISMFEKVVRLTPDDHPDKPALLNNLGTSLSHRFAHLGDLADLNRSISVREEAVCLTPDGHPDKPALMIDLGNIINTRFEHSHDPSDLLAADSNFSVASRASTGPASTRFHGARAWISTAQRQGNTTALLDACASALHLLPQLAWLGLPVTERHRLLVDTADVTRDSIAAALETGNHELAVEWLEQLRSIVWSQFLQLRTPVDDLAHEHPALAGQFREISQELEYASTRNNPTFSQTANIPVADTRSLEKDIQRHHDLAIKREDLLLEIRSLPGFDRFLLSKTIKQLSALVISGPFVYLTASKERCDALIVMPESETVIHVPLPEIRYKNMEVLRRVLRATLEQGHLVFSRDALYKLIPSEDTSLSKEFLDLLLDGNFSSDQEARLKPQRIGGPAKSKPEQLEEYTPDELYQMVLKHLWNYVVNPVLQALRLSTPPSGTDKMNRIFWCPTGPFSFLPIHAAGLYDTTKLGTKLSDFAISSYLPTLSSLASLPQNSLDHPSSQLRFLTIPQPPTDGFTKLFAVKHEIKHIGELSDKSPFVVLQNSDGSVEDVMEKLKNNDWVHFACHGVQDPKTPLDSGLCLANKHRLKLSDIMQLSRPKGGLAFLSACQTAQGEETLSDESVHLAAGMLLAGYGSVIGTMWSIMDSDAPKVAKDVYGYLFRDSGRVPDSTEAAAALHCAVQRLRDSGAPFSSWVPFIHFGR